MLVEEHARNGPVMFVTPKRSVLLRKLTQLGSKQRPRRRQREWQKAMGLDWQNNNFARASRFFVYFLAVVVRLQSESASFHVLSRTGTQNNNFRIQLQKRCQHLTN